MACAVVAALLVNTRAAVACVCAGYRIAIPSGTEDVPINLAKLYGFTGASLKTYGDEVPLGPAEVRWQRDLVARPVTELLLPSRRYEIWSGNEPIRVFTTARESDHEPPGPVELVDVSMAWRDREMDFDCSPSELQMSGRVEGGAGAALVGVRFERDGEAIERILEPGYRGLSQLGTGTCAINTPLIKDETYLVTAFAIDAAGNETTSASVEVRVVHDGGCSTTRPLDASVIVIAGFLLLRRRFDHRRRAA